MELRDIFVVVFSVGGAAFLRASFLAIRGWRDGSWQRRESAISDLEKWRREADDEREWEAAQHQWWRGWAGRLEYKLLQIAGPDALPSRPRYPVRAKVVSDEGYADREGK